jgi:hypothetical protein
MKNKPYPALLRPSNLSNEKKGTKILEGYPVKYKYYLGIIIEERFLLLFPSLILSFGKWKFDIAIISA